MWSNGLYAIITSFLITFIAVPYCIYLARRFCVIDSPDGVIKLQQYATPYLGGLAVLFGFFSGVFFNISLLYEAPGIFVGFLILFFVGLFDDIAVLSPLQKFFGQVCAIICFVSAGLYLKVNFFLSHWWTIPISALWMASIINACNLVDVMDGLATCIALSIAVSYCLLAFVMNQYDCFIIAASLIGSLSAFLYYNKPPAKIYLGDAGALFIGGAIAIMPFFLPWSAYCSWGFGVPLILSSLLLLELTGLIIIRTYRRIPFYLPSKDHFKCYLQQKKWRINVILLFIFCCSAITGLASFLIVMQYLTLLHTVLLGILFVIMWICIVYL